MLRSQVLWMYPIYCISFILNTIWYQEIADDGAQEATAGVEMCIRSSSPLTCLRAARCSAYLQLHGKPNPTPVADMIRYILRDGALCLDSFTHSLTLSVPCTCSDELYRAILVAFFLLQTVLSYLIPVVGPVVSFIHLSWLYSLYCFEYKWSLAGWSLEKRLTHLEQNWWVRRYC